jgi:hypothetical protein
LNAVGRLAEIRLVDYKIHAPLVGQHSSEAEVVVELGGQEAVGRGIGSDPAIAVVSAVTGAAHQLLYSQQKVEVE